MSNETLSNEPKIALDMQHISKQFPGTLAVDDVSFNIRAGEVHAVVGENGAGKSTLMKIMAGSFSDYKGQIVLDGKNVDLHSPSIAKAHGIGMIYQELSLARPISIAENLLVGRLPKMKSLPIFIDKKEVEKQARELLARVGLESLDVHMPISEISQCEAQLVEIAKVLGSKPSIIVMDEPTSALSSEEVERLFGIIDKLKNEGIAVAYISHHLQEIFALADRVTVMRDGKHIGTYDIADTNAEQIVELMVGRSISQFYAGHESNIGEEMLRVDNVSRWGFFHNISFNVHAGEVLGICGLAGAGRSELARSIVGIDPLDDGKVYLQNEPVSFKNMHQAIENGVAYLTESRKVDGLALPLTIAENTSASVISRLSKGIFYTPSNSKSTVAEMIEKLVIYPPEPNRPTQNLSGGNQQKVLMAKWIATRPRVLILDEPTRGVDVGAKEVIHKAILELAAQGNSIVLITSDLPEMVGLSDRAVIMRSGHIIGEISREHMNEASLLLAANGEGEHLH